MCSMCARGRNGLLWGMGAGRPPQDWPPRKQLSLGWTEQREGEGSRGQAKFEGAPGPPSHQGMLGSDGEPERQVWSMVWDSCVPREPRFPRRKLTYFSLPRQWNASKKELEGEVGVEEVSKEPRPRNPVSLCSLQLMHLQIEGFGLVLFVLASKALLRMS